MANAIDAIVEIFTWVGFGAAAFFAGIALILYLADGTWRPVRVMIDDLGSHRVARWFDDDGGVGEAALTESQEHELGHVDAAEVYVRQGALDRMRLTRRSPAVRGVLLLAGGLLGVGVVALVISIVLLFVRG